MKIFYYGMFEGPGYCENWIADALNKNGHYCTRIDKEYTGWHDFAHRAIHQKADAVLFSKIPEVDATKFMKFKSQFKGKIIFWTFDYMRDPSNQWYWPLAPLADICFQTDGRDHDGWYEDNDVNRVELHQAAAPQHDLPVSFTEEDLAGWECDVVFMGSLYHERRHKIHKFLKGLGVNYKHFGHPDRELWGSDFAKSCYFSKIVIGDNYINTVPGYWSDRSYLALGCGAFLITADVPFINQVFANGRHLITYQAVDDIKDLVEYYLPREAERKLIALEGYRHVQQWHTYAKRIEVFNYHLARL